MKKKKEFIVSLTLPGDVSEAEMAVYIYDAVCAWKGGLNPEDELFNLDSETVSVRRLAKDDEIAFRCVVCPNCKSANMREVVHASGKYMPMAQCLTCGWTGNKTEVL